jgi:hypothetical protein
MCLLPPSSGQWQGQYAPLKRQSASMRLHSAIYQKAVIFILAAMRTWNLTRGSGCVTVHGTVTLAWKKWGKPQNFKIPSFLADRDIYASIIENILIMGAKLKTWFLMVGQYSCWNQMSMKFISGSSKCPSQNLVIQCCNQCYEKIISYFVRIWLLIYLLPFSRQTNHHITQEGSHIFSEF